MCIRDRGVVGVNGQFPIILEVGEGLIDGAPRLSPGQPIDQQVLRYVSDAGVGHLVPDLSLIHI